MIWKLHWRCWRWVLVLHNLVANAQLWRRVCCFLDDLTNTSSQLQNFACPSQSAFLPSLAAEVSTEFFPLSSVWWAVVTLLLPLLWPSSPGWQLSWASRIVGPCWPICQQSITGCTVHRLLKGCHHLIMYMQDCQWNRIDNPLPAQYKENTSADNMTAFREAPVGMGQCDREQAIRACHVTAPENPRVEQFNCYKLVKYLSSFIRSCLTSLS